MIKVIKAINTKGRWRVYELQTMLKKALDGLIKLQSKNQYPALELSPFIAKFISTNPSFKQLPNFPKNLSC